MKITSRLTRRMQRFVLDSVTVSRLIEIPSSLDPSHVEPSHRTPKRFIMLTSDGRGYHVTWGPPSHSSDSPQDLSFSTSTPSRPPGNKSNPFTPPGHENVLFDLVDEKTGFLEGGGDEESWEWFGTCFHPSSSPHEKEEEDFVGMQQEIELDRGKGASTATLNIKMDLIAIGCEEYVLLFFFISFVSLFLSRFTDPSKTCSGTISTYTLSYQPTLSHVHSLLSSLSATSTTLLTSRCTSLAYTSDGLALAVGWEMGWSVWSSFGKLLSWCTKDSGGGGYGVEGEWGQGFEDHFLRGVKELFWGPGDLELFVLCPPPGHPKKKRTFHLPNKSS